MKMSDTLEKIQAQTKCEHPTKLGEPCDANSGGWWTCMCAVAADKMVREFQRGLAHSNGEF
jgi:hypothetical protein